MLNIYIHTATETDMRETGSISGFPIMTLFAGSFIILAVVIVMIVMFFKKPKK